MEDSGHQLNSPHSRRSGKNMVVSSPWNQVVRGESESNSVAPPPPPLSPSAAVSSPTAVPDQVVMGSVSSDEEISNGNAGKRPVWNMPSNGALEIGPVMGAVAWPALSEAARVSSKSPQPDGSSTLPLSSGSGTASSSPRKQVNNATPNSTPNHTAPARQRSFNKQRNGASSSDASSPQPIASQGHAGEGHLNNPSPRDHTQRSSQSRNSSDHSGQQRNTFRNRNGGTHPRADGSYNHNYGGRRDHDRGNQDWNSHRNFNGRDGHVQPQRVAPRFMRHQPPPPPPPASTPFIAAPPVRAFGSPMGFPELASPMYYVAQPPPNMRGMPFLAAPMPPHAVFFPPPDFQLHSKIVTQIDYYFSNDNLIRDTYLRQNMDDQGWVPINLIAGFKKVSQLTDSIPLILDALRNSSIVVEVQGDKVRRRTDWMRWLLKPSQVPSVTSSQGVGESSSQDTISDNLQNMYLEDKVTGSGQSQSTSISGDFNSNEEGTSRVGHDGDLDG